MSTNCDPCSLPAKRGQTAVEPFRGGDDLSAEELEQLLSRRYRSGRKIDPASPYFDNRHPELSEGQELALLELQGGGTLADAARAADVSRSTIYRWMSRGTPFRAVHDRWVDEIRHGARSRLTALIYKAATAVRKSIEGGNAALSWQLLKHFGSMPNMGQILESEAAAGEQKPSHGAPRDLPAGKPAELAIEDQAGQDVE